MPDDTSLPAPWDDQTDLFITDIDADAQKKYKVSFRTLLLQPESYAKTPDILTTIKSIRNDVESYFESVMSELSIENEQLDKDLEASDALYNQLNQTITSRASIARIPVIKSDNIDLSYAAPEILYIDKSTPQMDALITKFINSSNYIGDLSSSYRKYMLGSWLFSGTRSYVVAVKQPDSPIPPIDDSHNIITALLEDSEDRLQDLVGK